MFIVDSNFLVHAVEFLSRSFTFCAPSEYKLKWVSQISGTLIHVNTAKDRVAGKF